MKLEVEENKSLAVRRNKVGTGTGPRRSLVLIEYKEDVCNFFLSNATGSSLKHYHIGLILN